VFTSYDGLRVEANGVLGPLTFDCRALEMRTRPILAAVPRDALGGDTFFLQSLAMQGLPLLLVGRVRALTDFNGRPGLFGACVSLAEANRGQASASERDLEQLFSHIERATVGRWHGRSLPDRLNLLEDVPRRERPAECRFKDGTELLHRVEIGPGRNEVMEAGFDRIESSERIGRVLVLPFAAPGTTPADRRFVEAARAALRSKPAQSLNSLLGRLDTLERRMAHLERERRRPSALARLREGLHLWRLGLLAAGGVLVLLLVLSVGGWHLFQAVRDGTGTGPESDCADPELSVQEQGDCAERKAQQP